MDMWLFVDETWSPSEHVPAFGILFGVLVRHDQLGKLEDLLFAVRRKYYGREHAKDLRRELKGSDLLSNAILKRWEPRGPLPRNLCIVREILSYARVQEFHLRLFASIVYSSTSHHPELLAPDARRLADPFRHLVESAAHAAADTHHDSSVTLIFDQRVRVQKDLAIAVRNYVVGMGLHNVHPYSYFATSNASPGIQVADICAHLLSKRVQGVERIASLYHDLRHLQWESNGNPKRYGFLRLDELRTEEGLRYRRRRTW